MAAVGTRCSWVARRISHVGFAVGSVAVVLAFKKFSGGQNYSDGPILTLAFSKVQTPEPVFKDGTIFHTFRLSELLLTNRTVYDAYEVILMPTPIGEYQIFSSIPLTVLANNEGRIEYRVITSEGGTDYGHIEFAHNLAPLLDEVHKETGLGNCFSFSILPSSTKTPSANVTKAHLR